MEKCAKAIEKNCNEIKANVSTMMEERKYQNERFLLLVQTLV